MAEKKVVSKASPGRSPLNKQKTVQLAISEEAANEAPEDGDAHVMDETSPQKPTAVQEIEDLLMSRYGDWKKSFQVLDGNRSGELSNREFIESLSWLDVDRATSQA